MNITLKSLDLVHFKCFPALHVDFHEGLTSIYGANGAGKSSIYDALMWLLFNRNSAGVANPNIKPNGAPAGTMPEVTAILDVDGESLKLRKVLREKWERPRGSAIERYAGDTRDYYIDDVPLAENEYKRRIAELIDENRFKLLTDVWAVTLGMHWKDRRALLAEICGLPEDRELLATAPQFAELAEQVGRRTVDEFKSVLVKQRKDMNANLNTLPVRVDECSRMVTELETLDFAAAHAESDRLRTERDRLQGEIVKLSNNTLAAQAKNERDALQVQLRELEAENSAHLASQRVPVEDRTAELTAQERSTRAAMENAKSRADHERTFVAQSEMRLDDYRARWKQIDAEKFTADRCPTCGQVFSAERLAAARQSFEDSKNRRKNELLEDSNLLKGQISAAKARESAAQAEIAELTQAHEKAVQALAEYVPPVPATPENLPDYDRRKTAILSLIADADKRLDRVNGDTEQERRRLEADLAAVTTEKLRHDAVLAKEQTLADTRRRIADLQAEQRKAAAEMEQMDRLIALCEDFARYRAKSVEDSVNGKFKLAHFRLFKEQKNGGLEDCCEVTDAAGVPFGDINNAMQVCIGMDIIDTLSEFYSVRVPLFVDNAESVTHLQTIGSQVVRLVVSEPDKELRIV